LNKEKKIKAAITGVIYYLQELEEKNKKQINYWSKVGREIIMRNNILVQRRSFKRK